MSDIDFAFAWEGATGRSGPWRHLSVLEIHGAERLGGLYRYEISALLRETEPEIDPDELIRARATLRIATHTAPRFRLVHGIITEVEELGAVQGGVEYRLVLSPPLARAMHRTRCRIFLDKTTRQIIESVLQGDPELSAGGGAAVEPEDAVMTSYTPARELYMFRVADTSRIDDVKARPYCVQYNESDFTFVSRLLEEEGISYHFENSDGVCLLVLSDRDTGRARLSPFLPLGDSLLNRVVGSIKLGARLRPGKVSLRDYNWKKPALDMTVAEPAQASPAELVASGYPGLYPETPEQGRPLARAMLERLAVEASYAVGEGTCRVLSAGSIFAFEPSADRSRARHEGEYLVTRIEVHGAQRVAAAPTAAPVDVLAAAPALPAPVDVPPPYTCTFECARRGKGAAIAESRFRPARETPRPRILGTQTAFVTASAAAAGAEIHIGGPESAEIGCVRLRFHWDQGSTRQAAEPTSCWVRVSQVFAGAGQGAVFHPRVGVEVIVDFQDGDPDRPIVVGRVYNGQNLPPTVVPTVSTLKTDTSPADGTSNEIIFDDTAGRQQLKLHTCRDWNSVADNDRAEAIAMNSTSTVGVDRSEATGAHRSTMVGGNNAEVVSGNETVTVGGNQTIGVGVDQVVAVAGDQTTAVEGSQLIGVGVDQGVAIKGDQSLEIAGNQALAVKGDQGEAITGTRAVQIMKDDLLEVEGLQGIHVVKAQMTKLDDDQHLLVAKNQSIEVKGDQLTLVTGTQQQASKKEQLLAAPKQQLSAETTQILTSEELGVKARKSAVVSAPETEVHASKVLKLSGNKLEISFTGDIAIKGANISIEGSKVTIKGGSSFTLDGGEQVDIKAALIKLN